MSRRGAMWPTELTDDSEFFKLTPLAQWLFKLLWLHADLDSGGFIALQVEVWAKASAYLTPQEVEGALDELLATAGCRWTTTPGSCGAAIHPAGRKSQAQHLRGRDAGCPDPAVAQTARRSLEVIDRVYQQEPLKPPGDDADDKARKTHTERVRARTESYELLRAKVEREGFGNPSRTTLV